ncbi:MAG: hypothetical protein M3328_14285, partial [Chloroflexota bacterium]|nr:hypothetical protein [Chloroflexota bacterium]
VRLTADGLEIRGDYDAQDRLTSYGSARYEYSPNGQLVRKRQQEAVTIYEYSALGNLSSVTLPGGERIEYILDGVGRRIGKKVNGVLVQGLLYGSILTPIAELDGRGNVTAYFVYGSRSHMPDYVLKDGTAYRIVTDMLGSPRLVVNTTDGSMAQRLDYDEYGRVVLDTNPGFQPFGFAGGIYDPDTQLTLCGARNYDAEVGRWTSRDPILFDGGQANLWAYVANDPVNSIDPLGLGDHCPPFRGAVRNESKEPITILHGSKDANGNDIQVYTILPAGKSTSMWDKGDTADVDGAWIDGKFYPISGASGEEITVHADGSVTSHRFTVMKTESEPRPDPPAQPWDPSGRSGDPRWGSPHSRGAPDDKPPPGMPGTVPRGIPRRGRVKPKSKTKKPPPND